MKVSKLSLFGVLGICTILFFACQKEKKEPVSPTPDVPMAGKPAPKTKMDAPTIVCGSSTQVSINLTVTAGATGAPSGFSIQWMKLSDFIANGNQWYASDDYRLCKASFSGNANLSRYILGAGESVSINIGETLFDNGASVSNGGTCPDGVSCIDCISALNCGTTYIFHAFAHASSTLQRSDLTTDVQCATLACGSTGACTYSQGFWKTHGPIPTGGNSNLWPAINFTIGTVSYTDLELQSILNTPAAGNGLIALAHQLIAAKLSIANGAPDTDIASTIVAADALIGSLVVPPVGSGSLPNSATGSLITALTNYNEGVTGPGHCQ